MAVTGFIYTVLNFVNWIAVILVIMALWELVQAFSNGRAGNAAANLLPGGLGDALRAGGREIGPILDRIRELENTMGERVDTVNDNVQRVQTTVDDIRGIVVDIQASLQEFRRYVEGWEAFFHRAGGALDQIQRSIDANRDNAEAIRGIVEENRGNLAAIQERCDEFNRGIAILRRELEEKLGEFDTKFDELSTQVGTISEGVVEIKDNFDDVEKQIKSIDTKIKNLPAKLKAEFETDLQNINEKLEQLKALVEKIKKFDARKFKSDIKEILRGTAAGIKAHTTRKMDGLSADITKQLEEMMDNIRKLIGGEGDAGNTIRDINGNNNITLQIIGDVKDSANVIQGLLEKLNAETQKVESDVGESAKDMNATAALMGETRKLVDEFIRKYTAVKELYGKRIEKALRGVKSEREYVLRELYEIKEIKNRIGKQHIKKVQEHLHLLQTYARREKYRADVDELKKEIGNVIELLPDQKKAHELFRQIEVFEAESLVNSANQLKEEVEGKKKAEVNWKIAEEIAKRFEDEMMMWNRNLTKLRNMLKSVVL